ncbi:sugar ABC transporter substrate-binding protein [Paucibacter sp. KBW04]|uniref:ABC transporter substrate-binding protein n=1 Tax=Paucibacter sp. KBW04 TaxID=2153361 RepID=UPI000F55EF4A|nr:ABC transporter substrate-binding protein [Paucibacter sp. KBW04]RQO61135.1 sugar ABC transporter substrate-binding protein [Paucibacter sp. KBW04]
MRACRALILSLAAASASSQAQERELELLHWWTAGSEAAMVGELRQRALKAGLPLKASAVAGASNANTVLKTRFLSGQPPALAQTDKSVRVWGEAVPLADLGPAVALAFADLPHAVAAELRYEKRPVAVPLNVHRLNMLWSNLRLLREQGLAVPSDWDAFHRTAAALQQRGVLPLAIGSSAGQKLSLFVGVVLGRAGRDFFERALVQADPRLLQGEQMRGLLAEFRRLKRYTDSGQVSRDWAGATALLLQGKAAFQLSGDWVNGEFQKAGWQVGQDYDCSPAPGHGRLHYFEFDRLIFFATPEPAQAEQQRRLASLLLQPQASSRLAQLKGGIPVRRDAGLEGFNACAQQSAEDFRAGDARGQLVLALSARLGESAYGGMRDVLSAFWASERMTAEQAQKRLAQALTARD